MNIKQLREITGLTQKKFGERYKIPLRTVQNWESGTNTPPDYIPRLIELVMILENEIEQLRNGKTSFFDTKGEQDPQQQQPPEEEKNTDTVTNWTEKEKLASKILSYLDDIDDLSCEDCIYDNTEECRNHDCIIQNHKQYKEIVELIGRGAKK